jgi:hypothetical protein
MREAQKHVDPVDPDPQHCKIVLTNTVKLLALSICSFFSSILNSGSIYGK